MKGIDPLAVISGILLTLGGIVLIVLSFFLVFTIIWGVILLLIGVAILFTLRRQEEIEQIKKSK